jgi:prolyl oligopeptidase
MANGRQRNGHRRLCAAAWVAGLVSLPGVAQGPSGARPVHGANGITLPAPPSTEKHTVTQNLHGETITDNYRWLEDQKAPATRAWLEQQNDYTEQYLAQVKMRPETEAQLTRLMRVESYSVPQLRGNRYFFKKRLPDENQGSLYMRTGIAGMDEKLVDAAKLSADQNTSIDVEDITSDGGLLAYGVRQGGADEVAIHMLDVAKRQELPDQLVSQRYLGVQISPDKKGLYYSLFTHAGTLVYWHAFGTAQSADKVIFGGEYQGEKLGELDLVGIAISDNGHWLILSIDHGVPAKRADILLKDLRQPDAPVIPLVYGIDNRFSLLDAGTDEFLVQTGWKAQNGRILLADMKSKPEAWKTIVPEERNVIESASVVGGKLFVERLADVKSETSIYELDGRHAGSLGYPGIGTGSVVYGRPLAKEGFYTFQSFNVPPTIYRYQTEASKSEVFAALQVPFDSAKYEVRQVFYTSKDGTRVPMFLAGKKGMALTGKTRVLMTAYGGFNVSMTAGWNPMYAWWMEQGGLFAQPELRGGGEYGEEWHKAGMFEKKQQVFDDFFAAAEYLIANKYTDREHLGIWGRSNGGLLMGAAMTQHPELFGAIVCGYPLLDMLRYQNFLFGRLWTTEYGSAESAADYKYLRAYSPYQNVHAGTHYPAIMFFSGDNDTRVDPLHARKMAAEVQAANGGDRPVLLHYSMKGGHSAGVSVTQQVADYGDILSFLWNETDARE